MKPTQEKLFAFLKTCEQRGEAFDIEAAADASGLSASSVKTYLSKKLRRRWVEQDAEGGYRVRGILNVSAAEFEQVMAQNATRADSYAGWCRALQDVLEDGVASGYPVQRTLDDLVRALGLK